MKKPFLTLTLIFLCVLYSTAQQGILKTSFDKDSIINLEYLTLKLT